jgi:hypothetical protein
MVKTGAVISAALMLAACASTSSGPNLNTEERLALYRANSTPVGSFRVDNRAGRVHKWNALGDQALTVWAWGNQPYLLELRNRCSGLGFATHINISNSFGSVSPGFDSVQPLSAGRQATSPSCRISTARRIDQGGVNQAKRDLREAQDASLVERDPNARPEDNAT